MRTQMGYKYYKVSYGHPDDGYPTTREFNTEEGAEAFVNELSDNKYCKPIVIRAIEIIAIIE